MVRTVSGRCTNTLGRASASNRHITKLEQSTFLRYLCMNSEPKRAYLQLLRVFFQTQSFISQTRQFQLSQKRSMPFRGMEWSWLKNTFSKNIDLFKSITQCVDVDKLSYSLQHFLLLFSVGRIHRHKTIELEVYKNVCREMGSLLSFVYIFGRVACQCC